MLEPANGRTSQDDPATWRQQRVDGSLPLGNAYTASCYPATRRFQARRGKLFLYQPHEAIAGSEAEGEDPIVARAVTAHYLFDGYPGTLGNSCKLGPHA